MRNWAGLLAPLLVAAAIVLGEYSDTAAHWSVTIRPILVAMVVALVLAGAGLLLLRQPVRAAALTIAALFVLTGSRSAFIGVATVALVLLVIAVRRRAVPEISPRLLTGLAGAFLLAGVVRLFILGTVTASDVGVGSRPEQGSTPGGPSIYMLILDAYARADTMAQMGFDNEPFLTALERRGFDVYRDSRSNYEWTTSTLASMLNMRPLHEIDGLPPPGTSDRVQTRALRLAINNASALAFLRREGYEIVSIPPLATYAALLNADEILDSGHLTEFEIHMLQDTTLAGMLDIVAPDFIADQHRARVSDTFEAVAPRREPTFMLAHVISPHEPFVFDANGGPVPMPDCFPECWFWTPWDHFSEDEFAARYLPQAQYVNSQTLAAVDRVIRGDPDAVVVVMSDHGSRGMPSNEAETFRNLLAVRSPGHRGLLGERPTPVNLLGAILGAYFNNQLVEWPNDQYRGRHLDAVRIPPVE